MDLAVLVKVCVVIVQRQKMSIWMKFRKYLVMLTTLQCSCAQADHDPTCLSLCMTWPHSGLFGTLCVFYTLHVGVAKTYNDKFFSMNQVEDTLIRTGSQE